MRYLPLLLTAALGAAEPVAVISIAGRDALEPAWTGSAWGAFAAHPAMAKLISSATAATLVAKADALTRVQGARLVANTDGGEWTVQCASPAAAKAWIQASDSLKDLEFTITPAASGATVVFGWDKRPATVVRRTSHHLEATFDVAAALAKEPATARAAAAAAPQRVLLTSDLIPAGSHDVMDLTWPMAAPALATLDSGAASDLPAEAIITAGLAVDGPRLAEVISAGMDANSRQRLDQALLSIGVSGGLPAIAPLVTGTWTASVTGGIPVPGVIVGAPRRPAQDAQVLALLAKLPQWDANDTAGPWQIPLGDSPMSLTVERCPDRWWFSLGLTGEVVRRTTWPVGVAATAAGFLRLETPAALKTWGGMASLAAGKDPEIRKLIQAVITAGMATLPAQQWLVFRAKDHVIIDGRGPLGITGAPVAARLVMPAITMARTMALKAKTGNNLKQLVTIMHAFAVDNNGKLPATLAELIAWPESELSASVLRSPSGERRGIPEPHFRYLRAKGENSLRTSVPLIVEDPACNDARGCNVVFGDSHFEWIPAPRSTVLWQAITAKPVDYVWPWKEAQELPGLRQP